MVASSLVSSNVFRLMVVRPEPPEKAKENPACACRGFRLVESSSIVRSYQRFFFFDQVARGSSSSNAEMGTIALAAPSLFGKRGICMLVSACNASLASPEKRKPYLLSLMINSACIVEFSTVKMQLCTFSKGESVCASTV